MTIQQKEKNFKVSAVPFAKVSTEPFAKVSVVPMNHFTVKLKSTYWIFFNAWNIPFRFKIVVKGNSQNFFFLFSDNNYLKLSSSWPLWSTPKSLVVICIEISNLKWDLKRGQSWRYYPNAPPPPPPPPQQLFTDWMHLIETL